MVGYGKEILKLLLEKPRGSLPTFEVKFKQKPGPGEVVGNVVDVALDADAHNTAPRFRSTHLAYEDNEFTVRDFVADLPPLCVLYG
jgi:hypothetical protein